MPCPICTGALVSKAAASVAAVVGAAKQVKKTRKKPKSKNK
jgi:hypothetical protein